MNVGGGENELIRETIRRRKKLCRRVKQKNLQGQEGGVINNES